MGYGARAVNPYLAHECIKELIDKGLLDKDLHVAIEDYNSAVLHGIVKIASKMGISTIQSYQSAQIFEIIGLSTDVVSKYFTNTASRVEGIGMEEIAETVQFRHNQGLTHWGWRPIRRWTASASISCAAERTRKSTSITR